MKIDPTKGGWITCTDWVMDSRPLAFHPVALRKDFSLPERPASAQILITGSEKYALWINGSLIGYGPGRSYPQRKLYDEYDVTECVRKGRNCIAAMITPCSGANYVGNFTRMGLFAQLRIKLKSGREVVVVTDENWSSRMADWIGLNYLLISLPIGQQEHAQLNDETDRWLRADLTSEGWAPAGFIGPYDSPPWLSLEPRPVPPPVETMLTPKLIWHGAASRAMHDVSENLAPVFNEQRVVGQHADVKSASGIFSNTKQNVWTFDFGRTRFLRPAVTITKAAGPVRLELFYEMRFEKRPTAYLGFGSPMEGGCDSVTVTSVGHWEAMNPRGFRFLTVKATGPGKIEFRLSGRTVDYPYPDNATFECDDPFISQLWEVSKNNLRSSTTDTVVDCCSRENLLWTMDAAVATKAAYYSFGETAMWRHCLDLIGQGIDADGRPSAVVPADIPSSLFGQTMYWAISSGEYYRATADASLLQAIAEPLLRYLRQCQQNMTDEDLFVPPAHSWNWVDWAPIDGREYSLPVNALLAMACETAGAMARTIRHRPLSQIAGDIRRRLLRAMPRFFDARAQAFRSRIPPRHKLRLPPGRISSRSSELAQSLTHNVYANVLAYRAGAGTAAMRQAALRHAAACFEQSGAIGHIGLGGVDTILAPIFETGFAQVGLQKLRGLYQPFLDAGAPTWGSQAPMDGQAVSPFNTAHGWSASVNSLIVERLIGLRPVEPGWRKIDLSPTQGLSFDFSYRLETAAGLVAIEAQDGRWRARWPKGAVLSFAGKIRRGAGRAVEL